jgi:hypothetical protein
MHAYTLVQSLLTYLDGLCGAPANAGYVEYGECLARTTFAQANELCVNMFMTRGNDTSECDAVRSSSECLSADVLKQCHADALRFMYVATNMWLRSHPGKCIVEIPAALNLPPVAQNTSAYKCHTFVHETSFCSRQQSIKFCAGAETGTKVGAEAGAETEAEVGAEI